MTRASHTPEPRKLVDEIVPSSKYGQLRGLLGTSFDLNPEFVETDFLPSLLGVRAWDDRRWSARVAIERELARMDAVALFMDARRYLGRPRSLRVELMPAVGAGGQVLHAKVLLLAYEAAVKLVVGSANLTEPGYRLNREVAVSLTAAKGRPFEAALVRAAVVSMPDLLAAWWSDGAARVAEQALEILGPWASADGSADESFVWGGGSVPVWRQFLAAWPPEERVQELTIVSPFWSEEHGEGPVARLLDELTALGALRADAGLRLVCAAASETQSTYRPVLPPSFATFDGRRWSLRATAVAADPRVGPEELGGRDDVLRERALHAKVVLLRGQRTSLAYVGSANFTHKGWGFLPDPSRANIEAGFLLRRTGSSRAALDGLVPPVTGTEVPLSGAASGTLAPPEPKDAAPAWPTFVVAVRLAPAPGNPELLALEVQIRAERVMGSFSVAVPTVGVILAWPPPSGPDAPSVALAEVHRTSLDAAAVRALLREQVVLVSWWASPEPVEFPINVAADARDQLPFGSGEQRPSEGMLVAYYQGRITFEDMFPDEEEPPSGGDGASVEALASGVDTSRIQSYQVREFVEALRGIRDDLRLAASTGSEPAMRLALLGAVSPVALAREILAAARASDRTAVAAGFQLLELLACLADARAFAPGDDRADTAWQKQLLKAQTECWRLLGELRAMDAHALSDSAFRVYERTVKKQHGLNEPRVAREGKP